MQKTTTLLTLVSLIASALIGQLQAQINLDETDLPQAGLTVEIQVVDLVPQSFNLKLEADTFHLDLSTLSVTGTDTSIFVSPGEVPEAQLFPESELVAIYASEDQRALNFLKQHDGDLRITGLYTDIYGDGIMRDVHLDPYGSLMRTPLHYLDSISDYHAFVDTATNVPSLPGVDTMILQSLIMEQAVVDGYGTIVVPDFGPVEVLRVKHRVERFDSAQAYSIALNQWVSFDDHEESLGYLYYAKAQGVPLMQLELTSSGYPRQITYIKTPNAVPPPAGISSPNKEPGLVIYPNPGDGNMTLMLPQSARFLEYALYDLSGRVIEQRSLSDHAPSNHFQIQPEAPSGTYHLKVVTEAGTHTALIQISP